MVLSRLLARRLLAQLRVLLVAAPDCHHTAPYRCLRIYLVKLEQRLRCGRDRPPVAQVLHPEPTDGSGGAAAPPGATEELAQHHGRLRERVALRFLNYIIFQEKKE